MLCAGVHCSQQPAAIGAVTAPRLIWPLTVVPGPVLHDLVVGCGTTMESWTKGSGQYAGDLVGLTLVAIPTGANPKRSKGMGGGTWMKQSLWWLTNNRIGQGPYTLMRKTRRRSMCM